MTTVIAVCCSLLLISTAKGSMSCQYTSSFEGINLTIGCEMNTSLDAVFVWATGSQEIGLQTMPTTTGHTRNNITYHMTLSPSLYKTALEKGDYFWCQTVVTENISLKVVSTTPFTLHATKGNITWSHCQIHEHTLLAPSNGVSSEPHKSTGHLLALRQAVYQNESDNKNDTNCSKQTTTTIAVACTVAIIVIIVSGGVALIIIIKIQKRLNLIRSRSTPQTIEHPTINNSTPEDDVMEIVNPHRVSGQRKRAHKYANVNTWTPNSQEN